MKNELEGLGRKVRCMYWLEERRKYIKKKSAQKVSWLGFEPYTYRELEWRHHDVLGYVI